MKLLRTFAAFSLASLLATCASAPAGPGQAIQGKPVLFPLQVGQYWIYQVSRANQLSIVENHIATSQTIGNTEWFLSIEYSEKFWIRNAPAGQMEAVNLYTKDENAAIFEQLDPKAVREELLFKFPAQAGDSWITLENILRYEGHRTIAVPAGTFDCHYYSITQYGQTYSHSCIAEGVGVIYSDNTLPDGTLEISRLQSWGKH